MSTNSSFLELETCARLATGTDAESAAQLRQRLGHEDWRVRYAAAVALGDRREATAVADLLATLDIEDAAPLYSQKDEIAGAHAGSNETLGLLLPPGVTTATLDAWRRRGRIKQAVCLALGEIGSAAAPALPRLQRYATDQHEDYAVRAAACKALGLIKSPASRPCLDQAVNDPEWCTKTEARKALAACLQP